MINDLARRCDAPVFEPHVTIHVGADRADAAKNALGAAARECKLIGLTPLGIDQSDEFIKTLFVQFAMSAELSENQWHHSRGGERFVAVRTKTALEFAVQELGSRNPARTGSFNQRSAFRSDFRCN